MSPKITKNHLYHEGLNESALNNMGTQAQKPPTAQEATPSLSAFSVHERSRQRAPHVIQGGNNPRASAPGSVSNMNSSMIPRCTSMETRAQTWPLLNLSEACQSCKGVHPMELRLPARSSYSINRWIEEDAKEGTFADMSMQAADMGDDVKYARGDRNKDTSLVGSWGEDLNV
jgi:hypothetical protein